MKKIYSKPEIAFESFSLSQSIAAGCEIRDLTSSILYVEGFGYAFSSSCSHNVVDSSGDGEANGICYHTVVNGTSVFNS